MSLGKDDISTYNGYLAYTVHRMDRDENPHVPGTQRYKDWARDWDTAWTEEWEAFGL